jgi:hypothetical protein
MGKPNTNLTFSKDKMHKVQMSMLVMHYRQLLISYLLKILLTNLEELTLMLKILLTILKELISMSLILVH